MKVPARPTAALCAALAAACLGLSACFGGDPAVLKRQDLFELKVGKLDDRVDLFLVDGMKTLRKNSLFMRNGIFYLANGNANKVMKFSSYGDLLGLIYNPQDNGKPQLLGDAGIPGQVGNKFAMPYTFQEVGEVAVMRSGVILAEDRTAQQRKAVDPALGAVLDHVVLRFSPGGAYLDYVGQEGIGGAPFPYVESVDVTANDDIVVVCRTERQWLVYWFDAAGRRRYFVAVKLDSLPVPAEGGVVPALKMVRPDPDFPELYLHVDYYPRSQADVAKPVQSRLYTLNLASGSYESYFSLAAERLSFDVPGQVEPGSVQALPEFLGAGHGGKFYFMTRSAAGSYRLQVFDRGGRVILSRTMLVDDAKLVDHVYFLSPDGVVSAFLGQDDHALVAWWQSEKPN